MRALIIYEEDEAQIARSYLAREGDPQPDRARPWDTVLERALAAIGG